MEGEDSCGGGGMVVGVMEQWLLRKERGGRRGANKNFHPLGYDIWCFILLGKFILGPI